MVLYALAHEKIYTTDLSDAEWACLNFAWIDRNRRMSKDHERKVQTSETLVEVAIIRLISRRLARPA
jgi:hypothetical protein